MLNKFFKSNLNRAVFIILLLGLVVNVLYLSKTSYGMRSYDVDGHIHYIEYVAQNFNFPHNCWECDQAPFYYILGAIIYKASILFGVSDKAEIYYILQVFSVFLFSIFSAVSILILKTSFVENKEREIKNIKIKNYIFLLISALFVFWPTNIIHSVRITNDILFYVFYSLVVFFLIKWLEKNNNRNLYFSILFSFLALITKAHGLFAFALVGICFIFIFSKDKKRFENLRFYFKTTGILFIALLIGLIGSRVGVRVVDKIKGQEQKDNYLLVNMGGLNGGLFVENKVKSYIFFDTKIFLTEPYINTWEDKYGRQYFWNFLLKNSLFGEFFFNGVVAENIAIGMGALLLMMIFLVANSMLFSVKESLKNNFVLKVNALLLLSVFMAFRIVLSINGDFRFILPILISSCSFVGIGILEYRRKGLKNLEYIGYGISILFIVLSILFFTFAVFLQK